MKVLMDFTFFIGIVGSVLLVLGAAYPIKKVRHPVYSKKNWLFVIGNLCMLIYGILNYMDGGSIFFVILQILVNITSVLMMMDVPDKVDIPVITIAGAGMLYWSLTLFEGYGTIIFVIGLVGVGLGYALESGTIRRNLVLLFGSACLAYFSVIVGDWIFVFLNVFFALFSARNAYGLYMRITN
jgi:hypothetical protein